MERFLASVPQQATLLDLGCGSGAPILMDLLRRGHRVVGVDFSREQLREARVRCPEALLVLADIGDLGFAEGSFAGIIAYDSLWHLPRHEHQRVFEGMRKWLMRGGAALLTVAVGNGELLTELLGAPVFYDAWPEATSLTMLQTAGFSIAGRDFQPVADGRSDGHLIVLAMAA
jgi:cyclopropane fatty-acyl-phospholipid synthase-like methyltransferase